MKVRHHRGAATGTSPSPAWSVTVRPSAGTPTRKVAPRLSLARIARQLRRKRRARAEWTCARCGTVEDSLQDSARHITERHPARAKTNR